MKIGNITATLHRHEIDLPNIGKSIESRMFVFVEVETDEGMKGFGITGSILPWAIIACIENHLAPALKGRDVLHTEDIHSHVWRKLNSRAYTGVFSNALSAIDIALWDIRGKKENRSIHELLGGFRNWAPTYATFGYPFFDERQLAEYAKKFVADGHKMLKMVVGGDEHDPRAFSTWCPKAMALIGKLPGTLDDRSIEIRMRRRTFGEAVERLRQDRIEGVCSDIRRQAARWAEDHLRQLQDADPAVPDRTDRREDREGLSPFVLRGSMGPVCAA